MAKIKDKYKCNGCGKTSPRWFGLCPVCQSDDIVEIDENEIQGKKTGIKIAYSSVPTSRVKDILSDENREKYKVLRTFENFPELSKIISTEGGILESQVILLSAAPGTGKSTLMSQIADENTLYISTEETKFQVSQRFKRCNCNLMAQILSTTNEDDVLSAIATSNCNLVVLDSLNSIENENGGIASYQKVADIAQKITRLIKSQGKAIVIISQVTRNNNIIGMESTQHAVDTIIHMEKSTTSDKIILTSSKNRFCETGCIVFMRHSDTGLEEVENDCGEENAIGTTCFRMVSGSKKIPMEVQALIVQTDDKPIRRSVGVNLNKLYLIDAILRSNDSCYNTRTCDIYLATSNGLLLPEGNDIVIANSLLSAYYNIIIDNKGNLDRFEGTLNLNGIINGNKEFKHIEDLIRLYKKRG